MPPQKVNILETATKQVTGIFQPHIVADINDAQIKVAKFGEVFDWHAHAAEDEAFFVLEGRIAIDFRDGTVELGAGEFIAVPKQVEHRPRSLTDKPVVLLFEPASTLNTGDANSDHTVSDLDRLYP